MLTNPRHGHCPRYLIFLFLLFIGFQSGLSAKSRRPESNIVLANNIVRFEFEPEHVGLVSMVDLATGVNHVQQVDAKRTLWRITFGRGFHRRFLSNTDVKCSSSNVELFPDGAKRAIFEWNDLQLTPVGLNDVLPVPDGPANRIDRVMEVTRPFQLLPKPVVPWDNVDWMREKGSVTVRVIVELPPDSGIASWRIWVTNNSAWGLWDVEFPKFNGFLKSGEYDIAFPMHDWGKLLKKCSWELLSWYPAGWTGMPMQFCSATRGNGSVYFAAHDPKAWFKIFKVHPGKEAFIKTYAQDMGVLGSGYSAGFAVMLGVYKGDWLTGCKMYRKFALTAPWTSRGPISKRTDIPEIIKNVGLWMQERSELDRYMTDGSIEKQNKYLADAQKYFEVPLASLWHRWAKSGYGRPSEMSITNPDFHFPARGNVAQAARELVSKGFLIQLYLNARVTGFQTKDFVGDYLPYCCKDQTNLPFLDRWNGACMCPATGFWQDRIAESITRLTDEVNVNGFYLDQIAASVPHLCFDKSHGHPVGGGSWWVTGYRELLKKAKMAAHSKGRSVVLTTECAAEPYMDGVDAHKIKFKRDPREIPMITAVYSGYTLYYGSPAWFQDSDRYFVMSQGRDFLWGCQNGYMLSDLFKPENETKKAFLKKVGKYRVTARKFLTYGELVDLINHNETVTEIWHDHYRNPREGQIPVVQGAVYKAEDGSLGVLLVNYLKKDNTIDFNIDLAKYGLSASGKYKITRISPQADTPERTVKAGIITFSRKLDPWEICVLEITRQTEKEEILKVTNEFLKSKDVDISNKMVFYDVNNTEWQKTYDDLFKESITANYDYTSGLDVLKGRNYHAVSYSPKDPWIVGGVYWVFVDRDTKQVIHFLGMKLND